MQDPDFEKEVREKMSELKFSPSESVWASVQHQIAKDKRRRPFFWIFLLAGVMLAGGSYFFLSAPGPASHKGEPPAEVVKKSSDKTFPVPSQQSSMTAKNDQERATGRAPIQSLSRVASGKTNIISPVYQSEPDALVRKLRRDKKVRAAESVKNSQVDENKNNNLLPVIVMNETPSAEHETGARTAKTDSSFNSLSKTAAKNDSSGPVAKHVAKKDNPSRLHIGFTANTGLSDVFSSQVTNQTVYAAAYALYANFALAAAAPGLTLRPSAIQPGFSYSVGLTAEQKLSKKFLLSFGLNYHYYSSSIKTGSKMDSVPYNTQHATGAYAWGNSNQYTNRYHFLELPVSIVFEVGNLKKHPMFAEAGLTVSQMFGGNVLQYDYLSGTYFESKNNISKTQLLGNAAYLFSLNQKSIVLKVGPQVQYGFTNLAASSSVAKEHLFFAGVKFIVLPKK